MGASQHWMLRYANRHRDSEAELAFVVGQNSWQFITASENTKTNKNYSQSQIVDREHKWPVNQNIQAMLLTINTAKTAQSFP